MIDFPKDFFWGAATSAYQVEGDNLNSDWWEWEKSGGAKDASGKACRHYELYREDFDLARSLGHNAHRLSIEWSRIEPKKGTYRQDQIRHYQEVILSLRERGLEPVVTLHHFTNPLWFAESGGWLNRRAADWFRSYAAVVVEALAGTVKYWLTINEPLVYAYHAYILGVWPPQEKSLRKAGVVEEHLAYSHIKVYKLIHTLYREKGLGAPLVSIAQNVQAFEYCRPTLRNKLAVYLRDRLYNFGFLDRLIRRGSLDFIGINYYNRSLVDVKGWGLMNFLLDACEDNCLPLKKNSLGWDIYPEGLYKLLLKLKKYRLPVMITENGICTEDDALRWEYIAGHLKSVSRALEAGAEVIGYLYWSLIDNFEWHQGFGPRFGLIAVDYNSYKRTVRQSAQRFAEVCKSNKLE